MTTGSSDSQYVNAMRQADSSLAAGDTQEARRWARRALAARPGDRDAADLLRAVGDAPLQDAHDAQEPGASDERLRTTVLGVLSSGVMVLGTLLPWETTLFGGIEFQGIDGAGTVTALAALALIAGFVLWSRPGVLADNAIDFAAAVAAFNIYDMWQVGRSIVGAADADIVGREIGTGLYVSGIGAIGVILTVIDRHRQPTPSISTAAHNDTKSDVEAPAPSATTAESDPGERQMSMWGRAGRAYGRRRRGRSS